MTQIEGEPIRQSTANSNFRRGDGGHRVGGAFAISNAHVQNLKYGGLRAAAKRSPLAYRAFQLLFTVDVKLALMWHDRYDAVALMRRWRLHRLHGGKVTRRIGDEGARAAFVRNGRRRAECEQKRAAHAHAKRRIHRNVDRRTQRAQPNCELRVA